MVKNDRIFSVFRFFTIISHVGRSIFDLMRKFLLIFYLFLTFLLIFWLKWFPPLLLNFDEFSSDDQENLVYRLQDLKRLKTSVLRELDDLESKRRVLNLEIEILKRRARDLAKKLARETEILLEKRRQIEKAREIFREFSLRETPEIFLPPKISNLAPILINKSIMVDFCTLHDCFDYSKCSILDSRLKIKFTGIKFTVEPWEGDFCIHVVDSKLFDSKNHALNHVILNFNGPINGPITAAMFAAPTFSLAQYRRRFDIVLAPPIIDFAAQKSDLSPARRKFLAAILIDQSNSLEPPILNFIEKRLAKKVGGVFVDTRCSLDDCYVDWLKKSIFTFNVIIAKSPKFSSDFETAQKLLYSLKFGAIPVILSAKKYILPFDDVIDWRRCLFDWSIYRIYELHFRLKSITDFDILQMRRNCRLIFDNYLANEQIILQTLISSLVYRLGFNLQLTNDHQSSYLFNSLDQSSILAPVQKSEVNFFDQDEYLGPVDDLLVVSSGQQSPRYQHNYTLTSLYSYERWNVQYCPHRMHEFNPFRPFWLSEAKFKGSGFGFKPINDGIGGSGRPFSENLGGNDPLEYFTIILLTYEREQVLISALARLNRLPYLHKILVVWNGQTPPLLNHTWPKLTAPYVILKMENNSLNNRFLHFREIETEAVLSMDDDVHLRQDEIIFGFRVWREARDRIVGFPGRFHGFDKTTGQWIYNSNHSCELSMVLTGGAFIHKYYLYEYSHVMSDVIRRKVDELMNCEDIAMNFLVSHITRKPPLKVTSRWTFRCPGCTENLSSFQSHFDKRHDCLNFLTEIYGYNPLINTQFRLDSVLFKTKIPQNHQKCFKYI